MMETNHISSFAMLNYFKEKSSLIKCAESVSIYSKPYISILLTVCNNISLKYVIKCVKSVKLLNVKSVKCNENSITLLYDLIICFLGLLLLTLVQYSYNA